MPMVTAFASGGGGGNPLVARVLAYLGVAKPFVLCVLGCFNIAKSFELCLLCCFNKFICHPELVSGSINAIDIKLIFAPNKPPTRHPELVSGSIQSIDNKIINNTKFGITPHLILHENKFSAKFSSPQERGIAKEFINKSNIVEKMEDNLCIKI